MNNIDEVMKKLRQRPPFLMVDRILDIVPGESAVTQKNVSVNEPFFDGHFPGSPIMPGVLIIEACAQSCSIAMQNGEATDGESLYVLLKVDGFKFVRPVIPGDTLEITVKKTRAGGTIVAFDAIVKCGDTVYAKGSMTFTAIDKKSIYR